MEIRKIKPEEKVTANMIGTIAFVSSFDHTEECKAPEKHSEGYEDAWAAFDENGKMMSTMSVHPFEVMFDGQVVKMAGIGGVATLPEDRNKGSVRETLRKAMQSMLEEEQIFSFLYPFSHVYYRKFGYSFSYNRRTLTVPLSSMKQLQTEPTDDGSLQFFQKGDSMEDIKSIYRRFIQDKNLMLVRSDKHWGEKLGDNPYAKNVYTYIWYAKSGEPKSYITFELEKDAAGKNMHAREIIWGDDEGLYGLLSHLQVFYPAFKNLVWHAPSSVDLHNMLPEPFEIEETRGCHGMNRVVDVQKALERMRFPQEKGQAVIRVTDDFLPYNTGIYTIEWSGGVGQAAKSNQEKTVDMAADIQGLTQLVTGYCTPREAVFAKTVDIFQNSEQLTRLFPRKDLYICDFF